MWINDRDRKDDPQSRERETQRLARDEYERPLYGSPAAQQGAPEPHGRPPQQRAPLHHGSPPHQNHGTDYQHAAWSYRTPPLVNGRYTAEPASFSPQVSAPQRAPHHRDMSSQPRAFDGMRAHDLMTRRVATVHPATSVERAARLMAECDCGALPVVADNGVLVGMVTDRDIAIRVVARGREVRNAIVADCMTEHVFACFGHESIGECMRQMALHQVRRMPIVDERGRLIGILAQGDLARHSAHYGVADERRALAHVVGEVSQPVHAERR